MALLAGRTTVAARERAGYALLILAPISVASCAMLFGKGADEALAFSHGVHVEEQGMDCSDCHDMGDGAALPTLPGPGLCLLCHAELDAEKPEERRVAALFEDDVYLAALACRLDDEVIFDHGAHVAREADCGSCHDGIEASRRITAADAIGMEQCIDCHSRHAPGGESCSACHREIDTGWQPPGHHHEWTKRHGRIARMDTTREAARCSLCHSESACVQCHQEEEPANHDNFFRLRGHSALASIDRQNCWACHREDFCSRCHDEVRPLSHSGMFGSPRNTHCLGCHFPLASDGCITCHEGTPSHLSGPPKPPDHDAAMNCRLCHGMGVALRHVDDGSDCNLCHL